jgi:hypothetical protein
MSRFIGLGRRVDVREERVVVVDAVDRGVALTGTARIPADDVEPLQQRTVVDLGGEDRQIRTAEPRAPRIDQQRADLAVLVEGVVPGDEQLESRTVGILVVDGNIDRGHVDGVIEVVPLDRFGVERGDGLIDGVFVDGIGVG